MDDGGSGVAIILERLLLCSVALICFLLPCSPARSFDPLLDHPLDDSLTAKEIKYIGLTTPPHHHHHPFTTTASSLLFSPRPPFLQQISSGSFLYRFTLIAIPFPFLPFFLISVFFFLFSLLGAGFNPSLAVDACQRCNSIV